MSSQASTAPITGPTNESLNHGNGRGGNGARPRNNNGRGRGGHGRGNRGRGNRSTAPEPKQATQLNPLLPDGGGGGTSGDHPTEDATKDEGEDVEPEVCFICASPVVHQAVAPCNHRTCHICALRLRALYKTRACAHCRTEAKFVVFTDDPVKRFEDFSIQDFSRTDEMLGIRYEKPEIFDDTILLLRYNCPEETCDIACLGWPDLHRHVKSQHNKHMCDLCTRNKKVFTHEHELFTHTEFRQHEKFGDDNPGAVDQSGFKGHPECGFCRKRFYGDDELFTHCRDRHEKCFICDRRNTGRAQQYYVDYNALEAHFRKDHFICPDTECLEKKFVVFGSEMDFQAHQLESHPNGMSKDGRRDARRVDLSSFDYRAPHREERGGRHGRGRGRDPNAEPLPPSSAQPMRRDELAYQRQMAIHSAQSASNRTFGGQLSAPAPTRTEPNRNRPASPQPPSTEGLSNADQSGGATAAMTPQDQARRIHHNAVMERASTMLKNDQSKLTDFRGRVSSYRTGTISANELIDTFVTLFDVETSELGKLIKELADIYENESKKNNLLKSWNDWRAVNEDYPSLPGPSGIAPSAGAGSGGRRVLKLKSSTAQSSRSSVSQSASWGNAGSASNPFPPMPAASANRAGKGKTGPVPWAGSNSSAPRPTPVTARSTSTLPTRSGPAPRADAFPALPVAAKPNVNMIGVHRGVRWDTWNVPRSGNPTAWGGQSSGASANASGATSEVEGADEDSAAVGSKKKGKKKQTLYRFG